jgi:hypothetical protein
MGGIKLMVEVKIIVYNDYLNDLPVGEVDYTLEIGESLEEVAQEFETTVEEIAEFNSNLTAEQYVPGRRIRIPYRRYPSYRYPRMRPYPIGRHYGYRPRPYPIRRYYGYRPY